jgi:hypothetical protein
MVGRPKIFVESKKVEPTLPLDAFKSLEALVAKGYGSSPTDVARYLILREIDDLKRAGVIESGRAG